MTMIDNNLQFCNNDDDEDDDGGGGGGGGSNNNNTNATVHDFIYYLLTEGRGKSFVKLSSYKLRYEQ